MDTDGLPNERCCTAHGHGDARRQGPEGQSTSLSGTGASSASLRAAGGTSTAPHQRRSARANRHLNIETDMAQVRGYVTGGSNRRRWSTAELTPTTGMKRQVAANPDTADVPAALRRPTTGAACAGRSGWRADGRQHREPAHPRGRRGARRRTQRDDIRSGRHMSTARREPHLDEVFSLAQADYTGVRPATIDNYIRHYNGWSARAFRLHLHRRHRRAGRQGMGRRSRPGDTHQVRRTVHEGRHQDRACVTRSAACSATPCAAGDHGGPDRARLPRAPMQRVDAFTPASRGARHRRRGRKARNPRPAGRATAHDRLIVLPRLHRHAPRRDGCLSTCARRRTRARHASTSTRPRPRRGRPLPVRAGRHHIPQGLPALADTAVPARRPRSWSPATTAANPVHLPRGERLLTPSGPSACSGLATGRRWNRTLTGAPLTLSLPRHIARVRRHRGRRRRQDIAGAHGPRGRHRDPEHARRRLSPTAASRSPAPCPTRSTTVSARHPRTGIFETIFLRA